MISFRFHLTAIIKTVRLSVFRCSKSMDSLFSRKKETISLFPWITADIKAVFPCLSVVDKMFGRLVGGKCRNSFFTVIGWPFRTAVNNVDESTVFNYCV